MTDSEPREFSHATVMLQEAVDCLNIRPGKIYIDATVGLGGHLVEIARRAAGSGTVLGIDQDAKALAIAGERIKQSQRNTAGVKLVQGNFCDIESICRDQGIKEIDGGILADIGVSSMQLEDPERGFSFQKDAPLDMRMNSDEGQTAADLLNNLSEKEIADILYIYGEEKASRQIARRIVASRPLTTTLQLADIVKSALAKSSRARGMDRSHPATRTFQALRIAVNDELGSLEKFLRKSVSLLAPGARLAVISFHSLEDRMVKQIFKELASPCICPPRQPICTCMKKAQLKIITHKPLQPQENEILANPRSRSAKLRAGERTQE